MKKLTLAILTASLPITSYANLEDATTFGNNKYSFINIPELIGVLKPHPAGTLNRVLNLKEAKFEVKRNNETRNTQRATSLIYYGWDIRYNSKLSEFQKYNRLYPQTSAENHRYDLSKPRTPGQKNNYQTKRYHNILSLNQQIQYQHFETKPVDILHNKNMIQALEYKYDLMLRFLQAQPGTYEIIKQKNKLDFSQVPYGKTYLDTSFEVKHPKSGNVFSPKIHHSITTSGPQSVKWTTVRLPELGYKYFVNIWGISVLDLKLVRQDPIPINIQGKLKLPIGLLEKKKSDIDIQANFDTNGKFGSLSF